MRAWTFDDAPDYEAVGGLGAASTLNTTRPEGETAPQGNPIGFIWPPKESGDGVV
jgi:hypothetical protein